MSSSIEAIRPGFAWNATRVASVLMIVIIAVIALVFWPSFETSDARFPITRQTTRMLVPYAFMRADDSMTRVDLFFANTGTATLETSSRYSEFQR